MKNEGVKDIVSPTGEARKTIFDLLIHDANTDLTIIATFKTNITALRGYLGSIGNAKTRDTYKMFFDDAGQTLTVMGTQKKLLLNHLGEMKAQWIESQNKTVAPAPASEPAAQEPSTPEPETSSAAPAAAPESQKS